MEVLGYLLSALVGVSLGLIGGGGSILMVPILVYIFMLDPLLATSYSLFVVGTTSLVGAYDNYRKGQVNLKIAMLFGVTSITTVFITRKLIMPLLPDVLFSIGDFEVKRSLVIMVSFALLMLMASIAMIRDQINDETETLDTGSQTAKTIKLFFYGVLVGLATGFLGAGGGFLIIPALVLVLKMSMKGAVGTSLLIIALNSLIGFAGDIGHIAFNWVFLLTITAIAVTGIFIGGAIAKRTNGGKLKNGFGWFVLVMGIYIIVKELFF